MLPSATDPLGNKGSYSYDPVRRRTSMVDPNGNAAVGVPADHTWNYSCPPPVGRDESPWAR